MAYWSRRRFVVSSAALLASDCAAPLVAPSRGLPRTQRKIAVIGGGLAGLATAHRLVERGFEVTLLEAKPRVGGRILTLRAPFRDGLFAEAGATHVVPDPDLLQLFRELGVTLEKRPRARGLARARYFAGERRLYPAGEEPPPEHVWSAEERALGEDACMAKYFALATTLDPQAETPRALRSLDSLTGAEFLAKQGASAGFIAHIDGMIALGDAGVHGMSALSLVQLWALILREIALGPGGGKVQGGTDRLTETLAAKLGERVRCDAAVVRIEQNASGARVHFEHSGAREKLDVDRVVIAIPAPVLRELEVVPALSQSKLRALRELELESVTRAFIGVDARFWAARGEAGSVETDLALGGLRDESDGLPGAAGLLGLYVTRAPSRELAALPDAARDARISAHAQLLQPGIDQHAPSVISKCWDRDPFQRGAYAYWKPGQLTNWAPHLSNAEGRLHFAGDHTSHRPGFMHGALASATRVIAEVAAASG